MTTNQNTSHSKPIVVDLDGTLIKTDLLFESANQFITRHPFRLATLLKWLTQGKSYLKAQLAQDYSIDATSLPYNRNLISWLSEERQQGRKIILATASHKLLAEAVANHLGLFDEVVATEGDINLKANKKRDLLISKYGDRGFDYIGNDAADFPVWKAANAAYLVSSSASFINRVGIISNLTKIFPSDQPSFIKPLLKALRPHQWIKNILLFIPIFAAHQFNDSSSVKNVFIAFLVFGITASSVYVLNDLIDISDDRHHHRKQLRPFAAGNLSLLVGWLLWPILLIFAFTIAVLTLPITFTAVLLLYFICTLSYSLKLKQIAILDVLILAGLYTLRIIAGGEAIGAPLSFWLLTFSMYIFLSLALIKRYSELALISKVGKDGRIKGRGYIKSDLKLVSSIGIGSGLLSVLVLALYVQDSRAAALYHTPQWMWLVCPILLFWICRAWLITHRGQMHDDPIVFAIKDKMSLYIGGFLLGLYVLASIRI